MAFPHMKPGSGTPIGLYSLGHYQALMIHKPESLGPISYLYMLVFTSAEQTHPVLVVTCERNEMQEELVKAAVLDADVSSVRGWFLGYFDKDGTHHTLDKFAEDTPDEPSFRSRAFRIAQSRLRIAEPPKRIEPNAERPAAKVKQWNWKYILLLILAIPVAKHLGSYIGEGAAKLRPISTQDASHDRGVRVLVASQDAEGVTQRDLDLEALKNLEVYSVKQSEKKTKEYLAVQGYPDAVVSFTSGATYVESGSMKLAVIRIRGSVASNEMYGVEIYGIVGNEFKRILCIRESAEAIPISYGVCADKIQEVFGVRIGG